jgi:hypothetical protein
MEDYTRVIFVKITDDKVVIVDGEKYLLVDPEMFNSLKAHYVPRSYTRTKEIRTAILEILERQPGSGSKEIRRLLNVEYNFQPSINVLRGCLQRMREEKLIFNKGQKNLAVWYTK